MEGEIRSFVFTSIFFIFTCIYCYFSLLFLPYLHKKNFFSKFEQEACRRISPSPLYGHLSLYLHLYSSYLLVLLSIFLSFCFFLSLFPSKKFFKIRTGGESPPPAPLA